MCEYMISESNKMPICKYTKDKCTLCIAGNSKTYKKAKMDEKEDKGVRE